MQIENDYYIADEGDCFVTKDNSTVLKYYQENGHHFNEAIYVDSLKSGWMLNVRHEFKEKRAREFSKVDWKPYFSFKDYLKEAELCLQ